MKFKFTRSLPIVTLIGILLLSFSAVSAQDEGDSYPVDTINVSGIGTASSSPDIANIEIGVENLNADISEAFTATNDAIDNVIASIVAVGVAQEDIRTIGLNVYSQEVFPTMPADGQTTQREYRISNTVRVTVRDLELVEAVIDAAISNGANNIFGLDFGISERDELEQTARVNAMANARDRAEQLAEIMGVELGDIIIVTENSGGASPFEVSNLSAFDQAGLGGSGTSIETGQLSVSVRVEVTFRINR